MNISREKIINTARSWIGTPFIKFNSRRSIGCDCIGLVIGISHEVSLKSKQGALLHELYTGEYYEYDDSALLNICNKHLHKTEQILPASLLIIQNSNGFHAGIIGIHNEYYTLIHACMKAGKVIEHRLLPSILKYKHFCFKFFKEY